MQEDADILSENSSSNISIRESLNTFIKAGSSNHSPSGIRSRSKVCDSAQ